MKFLKLSATGNDFIALWPRDAEGLELAGFAKKHCPRGTGVGADGVIVPGPAPDADFEFIYYNYLGQRVPFCGNGTRALALFARAAGLVSGGRVRFLAGTGLHEARVEEDGVWVSLAGLREFSGGEIAVVDIGVRHGVVFVRGLEGMDIWAKKRALGSPELHLNFAESLGPGKLFVRTLEHNYPQEPLSCATGAAAAALALAKKEGLSEVEILTHGGPLRVRFGRDFSRIWLWGPVKVVYIGWLMG